MVESTACEKKKLEPEGQGVNMLGHHKQGGKCPRKYWELTGKSK